MAPNKQLRTLLNTFLEVPTDDPDDARRRKLLNILLAIVGIASLLAILATITLTLLKYLTPQDATSPLIASFASLLGSTAIYLINRYRSGLLASSLFLILLMIIIALADEPIELAQGRSLYLFILPIIISSILLGSRSTFIFYFLSSVELSVLATSAGLPFYGPVFAFVTFFMVALVTWLSSRSLEQALRELRDINTNLDQIVKERTHALAEALTRERIEAGRSQAILESITDGVIVFDTQGSAIQANPALSNLINVPLMNIVNSTVSDLVDSSPMDAKNKGTLAGILTKPSKQHDSHRVEWGTKTLSVSSGQVLDRDSSEVGTVAVFRDFTKEAELEKMKSAFVAMVSHELRTPISAILGYAEIFKEQIYGPLNEKQANMTNRIISNSRRLLNLINDLLDQAQMEAGKLKIKYETITPSDLLENLHSVMDKLTEDKGLALTSELDNDMPETLFGDSARLQQILVNLVNNAVKFTQEGSIHVQLSKLENMKWGISVIDTGQGIPKEEVPYIFDTFRQVEGTTTRLHGGFGLGLSIVKQLVNLMGGNITVESELGKGSTFSITLPLDTKSDTKEQA
jgi:signal transduction histidine kinase